jgi:hypothetical protein
MWLACIVEGRRDNFEGGRDHNKPTASAEQQFQTDGNEGSLPDCKMYTPVPMMDLLEITSSRKPQGNLQKQSKRQEV